jgi:hypothetical protein
MKNTFAHLMIVAAFCSPLLGLTKLYCPTGIAARKQVEPGDDPQELREILKHRNFPKSQETTWLTANRSFLRDLEQTVRSLHPQFSLKYAPDSAKSLHSLIEFIRKLEEKGADFVEIVEYRVLADRVWAGLQKAFGLFKTVPESNVAVDFDTKVNGIEGRYLANIELLCYFYE